MYKFNEVLTSEGLSLLVAGNGYHVWTGLAGFDSYHFSDVRDVVGDNLASFFADLPLGSIVTAEPSGIEFIRSWSGWDLLV